MKVSEVRALKSKPKVIRVGENFISESMEEAIEESISKGFISYYKITKVNEEKNTYVYEPYYEEIEEG